MFTLSYLRSCSFGELDGLSDLHKNRSDRVQQIVDEIVWRENHLHLLSDKQLQELHDEWSISDDLYDQIVNESNRRYNCAQELRADAAGLTVRELSRVNYLLDRIDSFRFGWEIEKAELNALTQLGQERLRQRYSDNPTDGGL